MKSRRILGGVALATALLAASAAQAATGGGGPSCGATGTLICALPASTTTVGVAGKRKTDEVFVGLNWNFGSKGPELVLGARTMRMNAWGNGDGARLDFVFPLAGGFSFDRVRLSYVNGHRDALGEVGLGYSFLQKTLFVTGAVQAPYVHLGVDYLFTGKFMPFIGVDSLKAPKVAVNAAGVTTYSCATGTTLTPVSSLLTTYSGVTIDSGLIADGQTCFVQRGGRT
jgi:hypothetical protein